MSDNSVQVNRPRDPAIQPRFFSENLTYGRKGTAETKETEVASTFSFRSGATAPFSYQLPAASTSTLTSLPKVSSLGGDSNKSLLELDKLPLLLVDEHQADKAHTDNGKLTRRLLRAHASLQTLFNRANAAPYKPLAEVGEGSTEDTSIIATKEALKDIKVRASEAIDVYPETAESGASKKSFGRSRENIASKSPRVEGCLQSGRSLLSGELPEVSPGQGPDKPGRWVEQWAGWEKLKVTMIEEARSGRGATATRLSDWVRQGHLDMSH